MLTIIWNDFNVRLNLMIFMILLVDKVWTVDPNEFNTTTSPYDELIAGSTTLVEDEVTSTTSNSLWITDDFLYDYRAPCDSSESCNSTQDLICERITGLCGCLQPKEYSFYYMKCMLPSCYDPYPCSVTGEYKCINNVCTYCYSNGIYICDNEFNTFAIVGAIFALGLMTVPVVLCVYRKYRVNKNIIPASNCQIETVAQHIDQANLPPLKSAANNSTHISVVSDYELPPTYFEAVNQKKNNTNKPL